jgi:hypothetical protein
MLCSTLFEWLNSKDNHWTHIMVPQTRVLCHSNFNKKSFCYIGDLFKCNLLLQASLVRFRSSFTYHDGNVLLVWNNGPWLRSISSIELRNSLIVMWRAKDLSLGHNTLEHGLLWFQFSRLYWWQVLLPLYKSHKNLENVYTKHSTYY